MPPRVLITRSPHQASELAAHLRALGADPILIPAIQLADPSTFAPLDDALAHLHTFHWLLFTSANAVEAFHRRLTQQPASTPKIAAIGPATARALEAIGLTPTLIPPQAVAESLTEALLPYALQPDGRPTQFLLIRAEDARDLLPDTLRAAGAHVTAAPAYRNLIPAESIPAIHQLFDQGSATPVDAITFTSSSSARNLLALCEAAGVSLPLTALLISIGPITTATLRELGHPPHAEASAASTESLAQATLQALAQAGRL